MESRRIDRLLRAAAPIIAIGVAASQLSGQTAVMTVHAEVADASLSLENMQGLVFGGATPDGLATGDLQMFANAGSFEIRAASGAEIVVDVTVPPALAVGPLPIPGPFGGSAGCRHSRNRQDECAHSDPSSTLVTNIGRDGSSENLSIAWLGGAASPDDTQFPGVYEGTVTLTAAYTGN
jgi:hypothetical protein